MLMEDLRRQSWFFPQISSPLWKRKGFRLSVHCWINLEGSYRTSDHQKSHCKWWHLSSPKPRKFKQSLYKAMVAVFWDRNGTLLISFKPSVYNKYWHYYVKKKWDRFGTVRMLSILLGNAWPWIACQTVALLLSFYSKHNHLPMFPKLKE